MTPSAIVVYLVVALLACWLVRQLLSIASDALAEHREREAFERRVRVGMRADVPHERRHDGGVR